MAPIAPAKPRPTTLAIAGDQKDSIEGTAAAGALIEAINLTEAAGARQAIDEYKAIATADANGAFKAAFTGALSGAREGDYVRVQARSADGKIVLGTETIRIKGREAQDTRNAPFIDRRLALYDDGTGKAAILANPHDKRPSSEPFAVFQLSNSRTGEKQEVTLDKDGYLPEDFTIAARFGDSLSFSVSDGASNADFAGIEPPKLSVAGKAPHDHDVPDPGAYKDELDKKGRTMVGMRLFTGPLIKDGVTPEDLNQGGIGDCYLPAALGSIAKFHPAEIEKAVSKNPDGTFTVTFFAHDAATDQLVKKPIRVDGDLYVDTSGSPIYGSSLPADGDMELWFPLIEKAYASWKGSYDAIGNGGQASAVMNAVLGKREVYRWIGGGTDDLWTWAVAATDAKLPAVLGTANDEARYKDTGIHERHTYSVLGYEIDAATKEKRLILRNPWGSGEPGDDGADDGLFKLDVSTAAKLFISFHSVE